MECQREDVEFLSHKTTCRAWLYKPTALVNESRPCIVLAHGLGGTRDAGLEPYAQKFAEAGYVALVFDYRHFGASAGEPRQLCSVTKQLQDWASAVEYARSLEGVDADRIALWGFSLSGGHAITTAVRDARIAAVAVQAPILDTFAAATCLQKAVGTRKLIKSFALGALDLLRGMVGMRPIYVPVFGSADDLAPICGTEDVRDYAALVPEGWRNEISARYGLLFKGYRAIASIHKIRCPILIQVPTQDKVTPPQLAVKAAQKVGDQAVLKQYDCGHMNICLEDKFEQASNDQLTFFNRVLTP